MLYKDYELFGFTGICLQLALVSTNVNPVLFVLDLHMKYTEEVVLLSLYVYCVVSYQVIAALYVQSVVCFLALLYTIVDNSKHPWQMSQFYSLNCSF